MRRDAQEPRATPGGVAEEDVRRPAGSNGGLPSAVQQGQRTASRWLKKKGRDP